jgi:hypothetical protein
LRAAAEHRARARAAHERHLRRDVQRLSGCLDALPAAEGRVLAIRAGLGRAAPASLRQAARRLGISTRRAATLERSGLRRLRAVGSAGGCGQASGGSDGGAVLGGSAGAGVPALEPTIVLASRQTFTSTAELARRSARAAGHGAVADANAGAAGGRAAPDSAAGTVRRAGVVAAAGEGSTKVGPYLAALALLALLLAASAVAWRRRHEPGAPRLAEQTGTAAVWWSPVEDPEAAPPAGPEAAAEQELTEPEAVEPAPAATPEPPLAPAGAPRRRPRPAAVAAASLVSLGVALLRRRRR